MKMFKEYLFLLFLINIHNSSCALETTYNIGKAIWRLHLMIDKITSNSTETVKSLITDNTMRNQEIRKQMDEIHKQFNQMEEFMKPKIIHDSFNSWPFSILLFKSIDTVEIFAQSIDEFYKDFFQHINETSYDSDLVLEYLKSIVPNIEDRIYAIRKNVIGRNEFLPDHQSLVNAITSSAIILQTQFCDSTRIISYFLVQLFKMVMIAEMKVNIMLAIARLNQLPQLSGWTDLYTKEQFDRRFRLYVHEFSLNIELTDSIYLRACDPPGNKWKRDESFYELEETFQTAIFHYDSMKCNFESCHDAWFHKARICDAQYYDARSKCLGTLTECTSLYTMQACVLTNGPHKFLYANSSELGLLGENSECPKDGGYLLEAGTSENFTQATCACNCHEKDSKISLFLMESMVEWNMVIIGVRFIRQNGILYIQPREGKLGFDGHVFRYPQRWIPIPKHIPESEIYSTKEESTVFFLDDVQLPPGFILTGVKFNKVKRGYVTGLAIRIYGIPFDYKTGKLNVNRQFSFSKGESNSNPGQPLSFMAISSVYGHVAHTPSQQSMKYVALQRSRLREDFGQSALPLFDAVPVTVHSPSVLSGMGIFHKGAEGYAGFISLRVYGIRYAKYFTDFQSTYIKNDTMILWIE